MGMLRYIGIRWAKHKKSVYRTKKTYAGVKKRERKSESGLAKKGKRKGETIPRQGFFHFFLSL